MGAWTSIEPHGSSGYRIGNSRVSVIVGGEGGNMGAFEAALLESGTLR